MGVCGSVKLSSHFSSLLVHSISRGPVQAVTVESSDVDCSLNLHYQADAICDSGGSLVL